MAFSALASGVLTANGQSKRSVQIADFKAVRIDNTVVVTFDLQIGKKVTENNRSLIIEPVLRSENGLMETVLVPVVIQGKRAAITESNRSQVAREWQHVSPYYTGNGQTVSYEAATTYESWMSGCELVLNGVRVGYNTAESVNLGLLAANLFRNEQEPQVVVAVQPRPAEPIQIAQPRPTEPEPVPHWPIDITPAPAPVQPIPVYGSSTADRLAQQFTFVAPISEFERARQRPTGGMFDYNMPLNMGKGMTNREQADLVQFVNNGLREGASTILFGQAGAVISRDLGDNNRTLVDLVSAVRAIEMSSDSRIVQVVITGFASPEGRLESNEKLAWDRAVAVREFLKNNSSVTEDRIRVYNGSVDWEGLRRMVAESSMLEKYRIMEIIDHVPVWDARRNVGRHGELMRLNGGEPYKYMLRNYFPLLRQAAYIKVYYENY